MIGVDLGSSTVKWFNGKDFGTGFPKGNSFTLGLSSSQVLVKKAFYPLCSGGKLKKLVLNDVSTDLSVEPEELSVAFCRVEKLENGCSFLIFVERRERLNEIPHEILKSSQITVDILGGIAALISMSEETFTLLDAGKRKVAVATVKGGKLESLEIFRGGFDYHLGSDELFSYLKAVKKGSVFLVGGGALSKDFKSKLSRFSDFTVPELEPFGKETPLYFNAYGLYNFRKSPCRAFFKGISLFSQDILKEKRKLLFIGGATLASLFLITGGLFFQYLSAKRDYLLEKSAFSREFSRALGGKLLAPEIQIPQKLSHYREAADFLKLNTPSLLYYLNGISDSVVKGVKVLSVSGSISSGEFTLKGRAESMKDLKHFTEKLRRYFGKVSVSSTKRGRAGISFTLKAEVKVGA